MSIAEEKTTLARIILNLKQLGWAPFELDDEGDEYIDVSGMDVSEIVEECAAVALCHLRFLKDECKRGTVMIVWGNSPEEIIADSTMAHGFDVDLDRAQERH